MTVAVLITLAALNADNTLWHYKTFFRLTLERFALLLGRFAVPEPLAATLNATEQAKLDISGYCAKGCILSMLKTALVVCGDRPKSSAGKDFSSSKELMRHSAKPQSGVCAA